MSFTLVPTELIVDGAITSAKLDTNISISGTLGVTGELTLATHLNMGDNDKIKIGTGGDLEIYHDGSNSYIANSTGNIYIADTNGAVHIQAKLNEESIVAAADGAVTLYHDNSAKLATASGGITVTGTLTADDLEIDSGTLSVDASNNRVGIGTSSPTRSLSISGTGTEFINIVGGTSSGVGLLLGDSDAEIRGAFIYDNATDAIALRSGGNTTRMTIDSSGRVLINSTDTSPHDNTSGNSILLSDGLISSAQEGGNAAIFNRMTSDGSIVDFRKAGSSVGNINNFQSNEFGLVSQNNLVLQQNTTTQRHIVFSNSYLSSFGADDGTLDLGRSVARWKDLYLSGGAFIGGTGSANQLDDYEEGTWTPTFGTLTTAVGIYQKIGNTVTVRYHIVTTGGLPSGGSQVQIGGLPFTSASNNVGAGAVYIRFYTLDDSSPTTIMQGSATVIRFLNINEQDFDFTLVGELEASHNNSIAIIGTMTYSV